MNKTALRNALTAAVEALDEDDNTQTVNTHHVVITSTGDAANDRRQIENWMTQNRQDNGYGFRYVKTVTV